MTTEQSNEWDRIAKAAGIERIDLDMFINETWCCSGCVYRKEIENK